MENMNKDVIKGSFKELKGKAMKQWAKLTDNDFSEFKGNVEELKGKVQKLYGYSKEELEKQFHKFSDKSAEVANAGMTQVNAAIDKTSDKTTEEDKKIKNVM